jgi:hypothetical protein
MIAASFFFGGMQVSLVGGFRDKSTGRRGC